MGWVGMEVRAMISFIGWQLIKAELPSAAVWKLYLREVARLTDFDLQGDNSNWLIFNQPGNG